MGGEPWNKRMDITVQESEPVPLANGGDQGVETAGCVPTTRAGPNAREEIDGGKSSKGYVTTARR